MFNLGRNEQTTLQGNPIDLYNFDQTLIDTRNNTPTNLCSLIINIVHWLLTYYSVPTSVPQADMSFELQLSTTLLLAAKVILIQYILKDKMLTALNFTHEKIAINI